MTLEEKAKETKNWVLSGHIDGINKLYDYRAKGAKKLTKFARKLYFSVGPDENDIRDICLSLTQVKDPVKEIERIKTKIHEYSELVEQFVLEGAHGTIMTGPRFETIYPVSVKTLDHWLTEEDKWTPEDEYEIGLNLIKAWMSYHNKKEFKGDITLFPVFGFSGLVRTHEIKLR